jgi:hypothetical protein
LRYDARNVRSFNTEEVVLHRGTAVAARAASIFWAEHTVLVRSGWYGTHLRSRRQDGRRSI